MRKRSKGLIPVLTASVFMLACSNQSSSLPEPVTSDDETIISEPIATNVTAQSDVAKVIDEAEAEAKNIDRVEDEARSADAHLHGAAELAIVLENGRVTVELETPLYNLLGFEHAPETEAQKATVVTAEEQLAAGDTLFKFNAAAACEFDVKNGRINLFENTVGHDDHDHNDDNDHSDHHADGDHSHDDHAHDEDHNHTHQDNENKDHSHGDHHEHAHKDVILQYTYQCKESSKLSTMTVELFEMFENLSDLDVVYLGPSTQKQVSLNRNQTKVDLTP